MASKYIEIFFLLSVVAISSQRDPANDDEHQELLTGKGFPTLKKHVLGRFSARHRNEDTPNMLNIQTLNLYFKPQIAGPIQRSDPLGRCGSGRCDPDSDEDKIRNGFQQLIEEIEKEMDKGNPLRCSQVRCDEGESEDEERCGCRPKNDDRDDDDDSQYSLRCKNNRCKTGRTDRDFKSKLERYGKKYKISDDLDAVVLDMSNLGGLLGKHNDGDLINDNLPKGTVKNLNFDYNPHHTVDSDADKAIVVDLGQVEDADVLKRLENALLSDNEDSVRPNHVTAFSEYKKENMFNNAFNFVTNRRGDKNILSLSKKQRVRLQKLRALVQRLGANSDRNKIEALIKNIILGKTMKPEILPHKRGTNNIYVPHWLHTAVKNSQDYTRNKKQLPTLTRRQKLKNHESRTKKPIVRRRNLQQAVQEYGVPFELQIQGLGQVNS